MKNTISCEVVDYILLPFTNRGRFLNRCHGWTLLSSFQLTSGTSVAPVYFKLGLRLDLNYAAVKFWHWNIYGFVIIGLTGTQNVNTLWSTCSFRRLQGNNLRLTETNEVTTTQAGNDVMSSINFVSAASRPKTTCTYLPLKFRLYNLHSDCVGGWRTFNQVYFSFHDDEGPLTLIKYLFQPSQPRWLRLNLTKPLGISSSPR